MKQIKKGILRALFTLQVVGVVYIFITGKHGWQYINAHHNENKLLEKEVNQLKGEVTALEKRLLSWKNDPFYLEKYAREQLNMARPQEHIYYLPKT